MQQSAFIYQIPTLWLCILLQMDSTVQVALRVRPLVESETEKGCRDVLEVIPELDQVRIRNSDKAFTYNYTLGAGVPQEVVYAR